MTKAEKNEYRSLFYARYFRKETLTPAQTERLKELRYKDFLRACRDGHGYQASESYMTSNSYDR